MAEEEGVEIVYTNDAAAVAAAAADEGPGGSSASPPKLQSALADEGPGEAGSPTPSDACQVTVGQLVQARDGDRWRPGTVRAIHNRGVEVMWASGWYVSLVAFNEVAPVEGYRACSRWTGGPLGSDGPEQERRDAAVGEENNLGESAGT